MVAERKLVQGEPLCSQRHKWRVDTIKIYKMDDLPLTKKSLGQHWLHDVASLKAMITAGDVKSTDTIVEVGPGPGTLTKLLVERAKRVIAIELDERLADDLPARVPADNLQIVNGDILKFDFSSLSKRYKVVANIPYYLTSHLIRVLAEAANPPVRAVLLVQKEVAERVAAEPNDMSLLAVTAQYYFDVSLGEVIPARLFTPPPKVDSRILVLDRRNEPPFSDVDTQRFFRIVKAGFSQRRKTLLNSLSAGLHMNRETALSLLQQAGIDPGARAQALSIGQWYSLYKNA